MNRFLGAIPGIDLPWKAVSEIKNQLYDHSFLDSFYANKPTLSIGNLTIGGTGKTPIMLDFVRYFENDFKIAVINRSYGGSLKEPLCLDLANPRFKTETHLTTSLVGDEALLLQEGFKSASVFTGPSKSQTAQFISENGHFDFLIVDDGFQHRKLGRNCDVVILDATEPTESYQCFPRGRARESFSSLKRADLVFITKVNLAPTIQVQKILNWIEMNRSEQGVQNPLQVFQFEFLNDRIDLVTLPGSDSITQGRKEVPLNTLIGQEVTAVSAIGNPGAFEKSLKLLNLKVKEHLRYPDHYQYTNHDLVKIIEKSKSSLIMTTEKDLVKFRELKLQDPMDLFVLCLRVSCLTEKSKCYQLVYDQMQNNFKQRMLPS